MLNFHVMLSLQEDEDVVISLTSRNPQQITDTVTFDYNHRAFVPKTLRYSYDKKMRFCKKYFAPHLQGGDYNSS